MKKIFLISDTHFLHDNIVKYCNRPKNHEELIINNWNSVVSDDDLVLHLGDIAAGVRGRYDKLKDIFSDLNGEKYLARGNHDHMSDSWYKSNLGFKEVAPYYILGDVLFYHYPIRINEYTSPKDRKSIESMMKIIEDSGVKKIIHGHVHQRTTDIPNHYNVSVEAINYTPIDIEELLSNS